MLSDQTILRHIEKQSHHAAGLKQLIRELSLRDAERKQLAERLQMLVKSGRLVETSRERYMLAEYAKRAGASAPAEKSGPGAARKSSARPSLARKKPAATPAVAQKNLIAGRLNMHRDGYGFVIPNPGQRISVAGDIYIHAGNAGSAMNGDQVLVELTRRRDDGRAEGRILRVLTRGNPTVVGTFHYGTRHNHVSPIDEKLTKDIIMPRGMERAHLSKRSLGGAPAGGCKHLIDADRVIGSEAQRWSGTPDLEGLVVDVEITEWPSPSENPRGRVLEVLGNEDDFGVDVEIIIRKYHLPHRFPVEVLEGAQDFEGIISSSEMRHRRDYRALPIVTIDGETARDFDDAVTVRRLDIGHFELQVHIADVAHYVDEGSAIDLEARLRGTSVYFPDRAVPMLPIELSTDLCSLRPQVERLVLSCVMEIDGSGEVVSYRLHEGVIRSAERMTYTNVNLILEGDAALRQRYRPLVDVFELMRELAMVLNRKRVRRGSIDFDLPEPVIEFDEHGLMKGVTRSERNVAHRIIEEFMLSANECVASYLENKGVASLYRIHEKPDPKRVYDFETIAATFGYSLGVGPLPVKRIQVRGGRTLHPSKGSLGGALGRGARVLELPEEVHITPRMYQKLTQKVAGKPEERILSYLMLRSLKQARYSEKNEGHFALAAPAYTHFTSPIRRYPDLIVHRILKSVLRESAEREDRGVRIGVGTAAHSEAPSPWSKRKTEDSHPLAQKQASRVGHPANLGHQSGPMPEGILQEIARESSEAERRADDAERELMEWKKVKFMAEHLGEEFEGLIVSVTKFGMFVELNDMFIEGLVPLSSLTDDHYLFHENTRQIMGQRSRKTYSLGDAIRVLVDRIDRVQRKIQFAVVEELPRPSQKRARTGHPHSR